MAEQQVIERTDDGTVIRTGADGQRLKIPNLIPILPIRNIVVFPGTVMPLNIGRPKSKSLLEEVMPGDKLIGVITQKTSDAEEPDGNQSIIVHGLTRFRLIGLEKKEPFLLGRIEILEEKIPQGANLDALLASVRAQANRVIELSPNTPDEATQVLNSIT